MQSWKHACKDRFCCNLELSYFWVEELDLRGCFCGAEAKADKPVASINSYQTTRACMRNEGTNLGCEGVWISIYMIRFVVSRYHKAINEVFCSVPFELERRPILN